MNRIIPDVILAGNIVAYFLMTWHFKAQRQREAVVPLSTTRKALSKLTLVSSFLVLCYTPALITSHVEAYLPDKEFVIKAKRISGFLALINSNLNPVLYVWRFYEVRFQFLSLFCFWNGEKLEKLREDRRHYFATFDISTIKGTVNANFKDP